MENEHIYTVQIMVESEQVALHQIKAHNPKQVIEKLANEYLMNDGTIDTTI